MTKPSSDAGKPSGLYPMRVVEQLTGLSRRQIRYYEEQQLISPDRSQGGHRLYTPEEVDQLLLIKSLMEGGFRTVEAVKRCLASGLRLGAAKTQRTWSKAETEVQRSLQPAENDAEHYFQRHRRWPPS